MRHRRVRHHEAGIKQATELFGEVGGKVARQYIISDLREEGWTEKDHFPKDEIDYVKILGCFKVSLRWGIGDATWLWLNPKVIRGRAFD